MKRIQVVIRGHYQPALEFDVNDDVEDNRAAEAAFTALNAPPDFHPERAIHALGGECTAGQIERYHRKYPSMSVGDGIVIDGQRALWCQAVGWQAERWIQPAGWRAYEPTVGDIIDDLHRTGVDQAIANSKRKTE